MVVVARTRELAALDDALEAAGSGPARACFVTGEAGAGKSTLIAEFVRLRQSRDDRLVVAKGQCNALTGLTDPYLPMREALSSLAGGGGSSIGGEENGQRLKRGASFCLELVAEVGPGLVGLFVPPAAVALQGARWVKKRLGKPKPDSERELDQTQVFAQYTAVVNGLVGRSPLVIVLEDLHWSDTASLALLFHVLREVQRPGLLVIGTYRPEEVEAGRGSERHPLEQVVAELIRYQGDITVPVGSSTSGREFVDALLDAEPNGLDDGFRSALCALTDGQALFTTEIVRAMKDDGRLQRDANGRWVVGERLDWGLVPARVEGIIAERIDRLPSTHKRLLGVASVQGPRFYAELVARALGEPDLTVIQSLSRDLDRRHSLVGEVGESRIGSTVLTDYEFSHALVQRWLYDDLSLGERRITHSSVADAIEELAGDDDPELMPTLAYHLERGGQTDEARKIWRAIGERLRALWLAEESRLAFAEAVRLAPPTGEERAELLWLSGSQSMTASRFAEARELLRDAVAASSVSGPPSVGCLAQVALVTMAAWLGDDAHVIEDARTAVDAAERLGSPEACLWAHHALADALRLQRRHTEALTSAQRTVAISRETDELRRVYMTTSLYQLGDIYASAGDLDAANTAYQEAETVARSFDNASAVANSRLKSALLELATGHAEVAVQLVDEARQMNAALLGDPEGRAHSCALAGYAALLQGDRIRAVSELRAGLRLLVDRPTVLPYQLSPHLIALAELSTLEGQWVEAAELVGAVDAKVLPSPLDFYARRLSVVDEQVRAHLSDDEHTTATERGRAADFLRGFAADAAVGPARIEPATKRS